MSVLEDEFGDIIRKAREGFGWSQEQLSREVGIDEGDLADLERYRAKPTKAISDRLAHCLRLEPGALWRIAEDRYVPAPIVSWQAVSVQRFVFPGMDSNGYLIADQSSGEALLVDPGGDPSPILDVLKEKGLRLEGILLTHGHGDHVAGVEAVRSAYPVSVFAPGSEWEGEGLVDIGNQDRFRAGSWEVQVLPCPGHTPGGVSFAFPEGIVAVGDTLFAGSLGRAAGGKRSYDALLASARTLVELPRHTTLLPGHGPATTVGEERTNNPFIAKEFISK